MLKELVDKRARLHEQASAILKKAHDEKREKLTAEEQQQFDALHTEMDGLKATIDRIQRSEAVDRDLEASLGRRTESPPPRNDDSRPVTASVIQSSEEDRLEGMRAWFLAGSDKRNQITTHQAEIAHRVGFDLNMKVVDISLSRRPLRHVRDAENGTWEYRAQGVATGGAGLFTVPDELMRPLEVALLTFGGVRQVATVLRTDSGADLPIPNANDTAQKGVILAENTAVAQQDVTFTQLVIQAFKYSSKMILVSVELLQDNSINIANFLGDALGTRIGRITNEHFTTGTGSGQPNGVVTASTLGKTGAAAQLTTFIYEDFVDLEHSVDPSYRPGASWMMSDTALKAIKKIKDTTGRPLFAASMAVNAPDTILGYPFTVNNDIAVPAASAKSLLFGAMSKYLVRDVVGVSLLRLDERFADFHQVAFLAYSRHDGDLLNAGTNPVKHFIHAAS